MARGLSRIDSRKFPLCLAMLGEAAFVVVTALIASNTVAVAWPVRSHVLRHGRHYQRVGDGQRRGTGQQHRLRSDRCRTLAATWAAH